mmetsp:Transcript_7042/g.20706  ORF Transcript_7042/g.20706 Transcript_7042/m.20706 type:complete len:209 (-) Transcript_7042:1913-2539(-)
MKGFCPHRRILLQNADIARLRHVSSEASSLLLLFWVTTVHVLLISLLLLRLHALSLIAVLCDVVLVANIVEATFFEIQVVVRLWLSKIFVGVFRRHAEDFVRQRCGRYEPEQDDLECPPRQSVHNPRHRGKTGGTERRLEFGCHRACERHAHQHEDHPVGVCRHFVRALHGFVKVLPCQRFVSKSLQIWDVPLWPVREVQSLLRGSWA